LVSWEQILEYRSDPDSQSRFLALRNWISEVVNAKLTTVEAEDKLEYLVEQYRRHFRLHKLKTNAGILETIVVGAGEFLENAVKLRWGAAAKGLFAFKRRRIHLLEGELTAPGREIAYIVFLVLACAEGSTSGNSSRSRGTVEDG
jgi:hypothetical protein